MSNSSSRSSVSNKQNPQKKIDPAIKRYVKTMVNQASELKFYLGLISAATCTTTAVVTQLTVIAQGITDSDRVGDRAHVLKMVLRGQALVGDPTNVVRLIVFVWIPNTTPVSTSILLNGPSGAVDYQSVYSWDNRQLYKILYDKSFYLKGNGTANAPWTSDSQIGFYVDMPLSLQQQFLGGTTTSTNCVWYLRIADSSILPNPTIGFSAFFNYSDS